MRAKKLDVAAFGTSAPLLHASRGADLRIIGGGSSAIVTTLGILRPNPQTCEFEISGWFSFSSPEEIRENTGWEIRLSENASVILDPSETELEVLREVDTTGALRKN